MSAPATVRAMDEHNLDGLHLLLHAMREEGKNPQVVLMSEYWAMSDETRNAHDWVAVTQATWDAYLDFGTGYE